MDRITGRLTVFFEEPFWVGVFERSEGSKLSVCKVTFGTEPKIYEVYDFVLREYSKLKFSPAVDSDFKETKVNPKRMQREAKHQMEQTGIGTRSQQALKLQHEQIKVERKVISREMKEAEKQRRFEQKQQKRKEKHKGH